MQYQADGKLLIAGSFTQFQPNGATAAAGRSYAARLNPDGTLDSLDAGANGPIYALAVQKDGKVLIGGSFTTVQPTGATTASAHSQIARLNSDGTLDATFKANMGGFSDTQVSTIAVQADGRILVGGTFTTVQGTGDAASTARTSLVRLNIDGSIDSSFTLTTNNGVNAIAVQADGNIVLGGPFTIIGSVARNHLARCSSTGVVDINFDPNASDTVSALLIQPDGKIIAGGIFLTVQPNGSSSAVSHSSLVRLNTDGSADATFNAGANANVQALAMQGDGKLLIGGAFGIIFPSKSGARSVSANYIGRFNVDGTVDLTFNPGSNGVVRAIAVQANGSVVIGGYFTQLRGPTTTFGTLRNHIARVYSSDGSTDTSLDLGAGGGVLAMVVQPDGKTVIGGTFTAVAGISRNYLARLNTDGTLDASFNPGANGRIFAMALQSDGKILVGGAFSVIGTDTRNYVARINTDGTLDRSFNPNPNGTVGAFAIQSDGRVLLGGSFTTFQPNFVGDTYIRNYIARVGSDGSMDTTYDPNCNGQVLAIKLQSDGKAVIGGAFTVLQPNSAKNASTRTFLARLGTDGSLDTAYLPEADGQINSIALQSDGKMVVGGNFLNFHPNDTTTAPVARNRLARINTDGSIDSFNPDANDVITAILIQPDQRILIAGSLTSVAGFNIFSSARINADGTPDLNFNPFPNTRVLALGLQSDGSILLGGTFSSVQPGGTSTPVLVSRVARFTAAGALDTSYKPGIGGLAGTQVNTVAVEANGKFLVGGNFADLGGDLEGGLARFTASGAPDTAFTPSLDGQAYALAVRTSGSPVTVPVSGFAVLNADGTVRPTFAPGTDTQITGQVYATLVQADGKIVIGGSFINGTTNTGPNIARFYPNGALDGTLNPGPNGTVFALAVQADGKVLAGGDFVSTENVLRSHIARYNTDGTVDTGFDPNLSGSVTGILVQPGDQKIIAVGAFTTAQPNGTAAVTTRQYIARFNTDGTLDTSFNPNCNSSVSSAALQSDGKIVIVGTFTGLQPNGQGSVITRRYVARLNTDGTLDSFDPEANSTVTSVAVQGDGKILIGGYFSTLQPNASTTITSSNYLARFNSDGSLDSSFQPNPNAGITSLQVQTNGQILVGGVFTTISNAARNHVARLNTDGTIDTTFDPSPDGAINTAVPLPDGTVLLGGSFSTLQAAGSIYVAGLFNNVGGITAHNIALLNDDGTLNTNFLPNPDNVVYAIATQADSQLIIGGAFKNVAGTARSGLARLGAAGTLDNTFNPNVTGTVSAVAVQADGRIVFGGGFTAVGGTSRNALARVSSSGALDSTFNPNPNGSVQAVVAQPDGKVVVGGSFSSIAGSGHANIARLNADGSLDATFLATANGAVNGLELEADGSILVGGAFTTIGGAARNRVARLKSDGTVDASYDPNADGTVNAVALQPDGKLLLGGNFNTVSGLLRPRVARIGATVGAVQALSVSADAQTITWTRAGASADLTSVTFEESSDGNAWTPLGQAARVAGTYNWTLVSTKLPGIATNYLVRAHGTAPSSEGGSDSLFETIAQIYLLPQSTVSSSTVASGSVNHAFLYATAATNGPTSYSATGLPAGLTLDPTTGIISGTATQAGVYSVLLSVTNAGGTSTSALTLNIQATATSTVGSGHLLDLSCLAQVNAASPLITGFVISGTDPKSVLLRAIGPALSTLNVSGVLANPRLQLYSSAGKVLLDNSGWGGDPSLAAVFAQAGEFALPASSTDAAAAVTLAPGSYTVIVSDAANTAAGGQVLAEIYDVAGTLQQFSAMSTRGHIQNSSTLTGGFVLTGTASRRVLIRGVGPSLVNLGVTDAVADPRLTVFDSQGNVIAQNDDWGTPVNGGAAAADLAAAAATVGDFALNAGSKDSAVIVTLAPGTYTAQVTAPANTSGSAVIEIYELP